MADKKLVGENYSTPELVAKVTGRAKYAEDYRAEGMLFARLLLSPMPHARIKSIDTSAALAMPGVKAILTGDDVPGPKDQINDNGQVIRANPRSETALATEAMYQGQPVLAVCAVSELIAADAIELIEIEWEPLPFNVDPVASLMPGAQDARLEGNVWKRPGPPAQGQPPGIPEPISVKWNDAEAAEFRQGRLPMTTFTDPEWTLGDVEEGFKKADLILDDTFVSANVSHQCLESRSAMAYWQNGKLHIHNSTQGVAQAVFSFVRWLDLKPEDVVLVNAYTGGGYGSKGGGSITDIIPALLSKKLNGAPVMMRISREEEHAIGRARPGMHSRVKVGFTKEGRVTAMDMFTVTDGGPFGPGGDGNTASQYAQMMSQSETFRHRGITAITNTPPRGALSQPGGFQGCEIIDQVINKAARQLGIDQVAIRKLNAPEGKAKYGPANARGERGYLTSCFVKEALDKGAARFNWNERVARGPQRNGSKVRGIGVGISAYSGGSVGFDGLFIITPDGGMRVHTGIGNLGTESFSDCQRVAAEMVGIPWEKVEIVWGDTAKNLRVELQLGRQPDDTRAYAHVACCRYGRDQEAAADCRQGSRRETRGLRRGRRARLPQGWGARNDARAGGQARHRARRHLRWPRVAQRHQRDDNTLRNGSGRAGSHGRGEGQLQARRNNPVFRRRVRGGRSRPRNREIHGHGISLRGRRRHRDSPERARRPDSGPFDTRHRSRDRSPVDL